MARTLDQQFGVVAASDIHDDGFLGYTGDFLDPGVSFAFGDEVRSFDWVITNPPFRLADKFVLRALPLADRGVAMLCRLTWLESVGRYRWEARP